MSRRRKWARRLLWLTGGLVAAVLVLWGTLTALMYHWVAKPPALPENPAIARLAPETRGDRVYLGSNWLGRQDGLPVLYLTGDPFEIGYANSCLTRQLIQRQEDALLQLLHQVAPYRWTQFLIKFFVVYKNRNLPRHIQPEYQMEMLGLTRGCPDPHPEVGPAYTRILNYHAAQDISYFMMNSPLIRRGCTSFGAWGAQTRDGHLLAGRNFDWEAAPVFDEDRLLIFCEPKDGLPFISLAWAGMVGCVSGMNREGLMVTINAAPSQLPKDAATPTCLIAREVLQYARTIAEATEIIRKRQVFVSALFLVGSRKDGRFVVIEKSTQGMAVREPGSAPYIACANHYMTQALEGDDVNQEFKRIDTSVWRYDRMKELLEGSAGTLGAAECAAVLRDRRLPGDQFAGNGHRGSLNPLIATHSVIMDLTSGIFWASVPPHQLGRFLAFDVSDPNKILTDKAISEDPLLSGGDYRRYLSASARIGEGRTALKKGRYELALQCARQAEKDNPGFYQNAWLLGESLFRLGRLTEAAQACQSALAAKPALAGERKKIESLASAIAEKSANRLPPKP